MTMVDHYLCDICTQEYSISGPGLTTNQISIKSKWFSVSRIIHICDTCMDSIGHNSRREPDAAYKLENTILDALKDLFKIRISVPSLSK